MDNNVKQATHQIKVNGVVRHLVHPRQLASAVMWVIDIGNRYPDMDIVIEEIEEVA